MKKINTFLILVACLIILGSGCTKMRSKEKIDSKVVESLSVIQRLERMEEPLVVFYERGAFNVLTNFIGKYPDIPIHIYQMDENDEGLKMAISDNGDPDLIIMGGDRS